jgi:hypothetical protein
LFVIQSLSKFILAEVSDVEAVRAVLCPVVGVFAVSAGIQKRLSMLCCLLDSVYDGSSWGWLSRCGQYKTGWRVELFKEQDSKGGEEGRACRLGHILLWPGYFTGVQNVVQNYRSAKSFFGSVAMTTVKSFCKIYSFAWYHVTHKITWPQE